MFAADERVKKAFSPLSYRQVNSKGYGFFRSITKEMSGLKTNVLTNIQPTKSNNK